MIRHEIKIYSDRGLFGRESSGPMFLVLFMMLAAVGLFAALPAFVEGYHFWGAASLLAVIWFAVHILLLCTHLEDELNSLQRKVNNLYRQLPEEIRNEIPLPIEALVNMDAVACDAMIFKLDEISSEWNKNQELTKIQDYRIAAAMTAADEKLKDLQEHSRVLREMS